MPFWPLNSDDLDDESSEALRLVVRLLVNDMLEFERLISVGIEELVSFLDDNDDDELTGVRGLLWLVDADSVLPSPLSNESTRS